MSVQLKKQQQVKKIENFAQYYKEQCVKQNVKINNTIYHGIKGTTLSVNLDLLTEFDIPTFQTVLLNCMFSSISINGNPIKKKPTNKRSSQQNQGRTGFSTHAKFSELIKIVSKSIKKSTETKVLRILNLKLTKQSYEYITEGLLENKSIKEIYINGCELESSDLEILSKGISGNESVVLLDLSKNCLKENSGRIIGKILSTHGQRRDDIVWVYSLRGEEPEEDISLKGIYEVNLSENELDSNCIKDMCYFLQYDNWIRSLNFRQNNIKEDGVSEINYILENNESLISLDLRENVGFLRQYSSTIFQKLLRNIKNFKKKRILEQQQRQQQMIENQQFEQQYDQNQQLIQQQQQNIHEEQPAQSIQQQSGNADDYALIQEEDEEFQEPSEMEKMDYVMNSLYNENKINQLTNKNCKGCKALEKKLIQSEYKAITLKIENVKLRNMLNKQQLNQQNSWSAIQPNNFNQFEQQEQHNQNNSFLNNKNNESEEVLNKIEGLMLELTRMMDGLEAKPNDVTNQANVTYQMSNTTNTNNATYQLYGNQNNTFSNFLGQQSNNNSNIIPQNFQAQQQQFQQHQQQQQQQQQPAPQMQQQEFQNNNNTIKRRMENQSQ